ncbi:transmembrane emp24 domain-containing protein p24delta3-like isoform X2 [Benincasa hispida]|uniref:transmembrane emp24 domain-containing protein p24delta3-like isoform X2 n=1 Tax=Benincasa hispida TaxID=102211 RepID=UPI0019011F4F|nr:transmembrane emp24 domain-containing protein p24delta3-like isoform X2 [Benincasa hispida]
MRREVVLPLFLLCFFAMDLVRTAHSIWLNLPPSGTKCVSEEIQTNVVVLADYVVVADHTHSPTISVKVTSPYGNNLHHSENVTHGQFAFTTTEAGNYLVCFWLTDHTHQAGIEISVNLDWRTGIAAKDWESVAKKEKIEGVELELRKLEGAVEAIHENLLYLKRSRYEDGQ